MMTEEKAVRTLLLILKKNAPVRDGEKYPGKHGASPYPGNLKNNGITLNVMTNKTVVTVGNKAAPYAVYTETRSHKKDWQKRSNEEFYKSLIIMGGKTARR